MDAPRIEVTRGHEIHPNVFGCQGAGQGLGQPDNAEPHHGREQEVRWRLPHRCRAKEYDVTAIVRPHRRQDQTGQPHGTHQQEVARVHPLRVREAVEVTVSDVPRVHDQNVDPAKFVKHL